MKLTVSKRTGETKNKLTQLRRSGNIPAVLYSKGRASEKISVKGSEFEAVLRKLPKGYLPTTIFDLEKEGETCKAVVKEVQYHPTTYQVLHLDFLVLEPKVAVEVKVPLQWMGEADCVGVKLGGFIRPVKRHVKVRCLPENIPSDFKIDIQSLEIGQAKRVFDIEPGQTDVLAKPKEILVTIAKK